MVSLREKLPYSDASHPIIYGAAHFVVGQYLKSQYDLQIYGDRHLRHEEPRVYVPTHTEAIDPEVLGVAAEGRSIPTMAKEELWTEERYRKYGIQLGKVLALVDVFPVKRGGNDREAYRIANGHVEAGRSPGIFAQGTRSLDFDSLYYGAAGIAYRNNVAIQPLAIATYRHNDLKNPYQLIRAIASEPIIPDRSLPRHAGLEVLMYKLREVFKRDYARALGWAAFDAAQNKKNSKKIGRIKRYT